MKAVALGHKLAFLNHFNLVSFFILTSVNSKNRLSLALLAYMFITVLPHHVFEQTQVGDLFKCRSENVLPAIMHTACYTLVTLRKLLLRAGDIEANPGPSRTDTRSDLCIIHLNARSIKNKVDLIEAEANQFDIITVSETWLSQIDINTSIHLTNFHPFIRRDRPNDPHDVVAIYVKNNLLCKLRPDLQVNGLEAVWVETKINQESLLVGSFYRPPNSRTNYWELISDSIRKANNCVVKFIIQDDFNTVLPHHVFEQTQVGDLFKCRSENVLPAIMHTACYTLVTLRKLLLRAGDIEANPGPSRTFMLMTLLTILSP